MLGNPRIDKKTLLMKFISKMEMESNIGGAGLSDELSQIKKMINGDGDYSIESVDLNNHERNLHAVSHVD